MLFILITLYGAALFTMLKMSQGARKTQEINKKELNKKDSNPINYKNADCDGITWNGNNIQENPLRAYLGISISTLYDLDLTSGSYYAEGYVWLRYKDVPDWMREWDPEIYECPLKTVGFINVVEAQDFKTQLEPSKPTLDDDGHYIQWLEYTGRFYASSSSLDLSLFPFETIVLPLCIELDDLYTGESDVEYLASGQVITAPPSINGYSLKHCDVIPFINTYQTNWGFQYANSYFNKQTFSPYQAFRIETTLTRDPWNSFVNIFLPLVIVMIIVITAPLVAIQDYQTKLAIPASALLVLVFLQDGYKKILPPGLNYPTLADLIYTFNMFITIMVFLWSLIQTKLYFASQLNGGQLKQAQLAGLMDNQFFLITLFFSLLAPYLFYKSCKRKKI